MVLVCGILRVSWDDGEIGEYVGIVCVWYIVVVVLIIVG